MIVGRVLAAHGMMGEVQIEVISDSPGRFSAGGILYLMGEPREIQGSSGARKGRINLKLGGVDSRTEAESLRGGILTVPEDMVPPLPEGGYYHYQIIDMRVHTHQGEYLGRITEILTTGSNDVYVVSLEGTELLIPAVDEVIKNIDVDGGKMTVELPPGLRLGH